MSLFLLETILFVTSLGITALWCVVFRLTHHFRQTFFVLSTAFGFIATALVTYWTIVEGVELSSISYIAVLLVIAVLLLARVLNWVGRRQVKFFLFATFFPVLVTTLSHQTLLLNDVFLTFSIFILFFVFGFSLIADKNFKMPHWVGFLAIVLVILMRFFGAFHISGPETETVDVSLIFIIAIILAGAVVFLPDLQKPKEDFWPQWLQPSQLPRWVEGVVVCLLVVLGLLLTTEHLGELNFQNDEFFHIEAAQGYVKTGEYVRWDFTTDAPLVDEEGELVMYARAWPYTWLVAQSVKLFGFSEEAARVPSIIWYVLFIVLGYILIRWWKNDALIAAFLMLTFLALDHFILHARLVRMYSMVLFFSTATMTAWFLTYRYSLEQYIRVGRFLLFGIGTVLLTIFTLLIHPIFLVFFPAFFVYICVEFTRSVALQKNVQHRRTLYWILAACGTGLLVLIISVFISPLIPFQHIALLGSPNQEYELLPFIDIPTSLLAIGLYLVGWWFVFREHAASRFVAIISLVTILVFVFGVNRYHAFRYILFIVPMTVSIAELFLYRLLKVASRWIEKKDLRPVFIVVIGILLFVPLSFPGIADGVLFDTARADQIHVNGYRHDFERAYSYIREHKEEGEVVFTQSFRSFYWGKDDSLTVVDLGEFGSLSLSQLKKLMKEHERGWFVWSNGKSHHLEKRVKSYIENNAKDISGTVEELQGSNMFVYYYQWKDTEK